MRNKMFQGPDIVPTNGAVTGPLSGSGVFSAISPTGTVMVQGDKVIVGSTDICEYGMGWSRPMLMGEKGLQEASNALTYEEKAWFVK